MSNSFILCRIGLTLCRRIDYIFAPTDEGVGKVTVCRIRSGRIFRNGDGVACIHNLLGNLGGIPILEDDGVLSNRSLLLNKLIVEDCIGISRYLRLCASAVNLRVLQILLSILNEFVQAGYGFLCPFRTVISLGYLLCDSSFKSFGRNRNKGFIELCVVIGATIGYNIGEVRRPSGEGVVVITVFNRLRNSRCFGCNICCSGAVSKFLGSLCAAHIVGYSYFTGF